MKILIFGNSGSGKTTLARQLAARHELAVLDLDSVVWSPTEFAVFRPDAEIIRDLDTFDSMHAQWVIEGCYGRWMQHLQARCTWMLFLNPGESVCLTHCRARPWEPEKYPSAEAQNSRLAFLLDWVRGYYHRDDELSLAAHRRIFEAFPGRKNELTSAVDLPASFLPG